MKQHQPRTALTRIRALLITLGLVLVGIVGVAGSASANIGTNDYPSSLATAAQDSVVDPWGFYNRECVSFVAWRLNNDNGLAFSNNMNNGHFGFAYQWKQNAINLYGASAYNGTPVAGSVAWWDSNHGYAGAMGHVAYVDSVNANGSINIEEYNYGGTGAYHTRTIATNGDWPSGFLHLKDLGTSANLSNGSYVLASDTGNVYVMAGGAAIYVSSWANVGGQHAINATLTQAQINAMPQYPSDGTAIRDAVGGGIWIVAGGFPFAVSNLAHTPGISWVNIDVNSLAYLRSEPKDGTVVRDESGGIYVISGDAAMAVTSLANIPYTTWTSVDSWSIAHQMRSYPKDGTVFVDYGTGTVYVVAGEAPLAVSSFSNIPPVSTMASLDHWVLANQLRQYPVNGTTVVDNTGTVYVIAGGTALTVTDFSHIPPVTSLTHVDGWCITHQLLSYPLDNTYVQGYGSGQLFKVLGGATTRVTSVPSPATPVDDWAIDNQLHATR